MGGRFSVKTAREGVVAVLRPDGSLDAYTAADLRAAMLDCIAEQPAALVLDVARVSIADDIGLTVIAAVAQQAARWPGTRIVVAGGSGELAQSARTLGVDRRVTFCGDVPAALAELGEIAPAPRRTDRISPNRDAPALARTAVQEFCAEQGVSGADAAQLVASELVTNAVVHAGTPIELTLRMVPPLLHIAVRDEGAGQARIAGLVDESSESGRGLLLVDALAAAWGNFLPHTGKIVWATVRARPVTPRS